MSQTTCGPRAARRARFAAFTLVELLVVIGIIAVLIAILLPTLSRAREQAKGVQCLSNLRQVGTAVTMFTSEHQGFLPKAWFNDRPWPSSKTLWNYPNADVWEWSYVISSYLAKNEGVFRCPSDPTPDAIPDLYGPAFYTVRHPDGTKEGYPRSYRLNISNQPDSLTAIRVAQLKNPTLSIVVAEGRRGYANAGWNQLATHEAPQGAVKPAWSPSEYASSETNAAYDRHSVRPDSKSNPKFSGMSNYVFADGHAEMMDFKGTWDIGIPGRPGGGTGTYKNLSMWRQLYLPVPSGSVRPDVY
jgi:prepilin-type processing-associated H-X9-DG protein